MRYSVWDPHARSYEYYEANGQLSGGVFAPKAKMPVGHKLGLIPEQAAYPLPVGAVLVGKGATPVGLIASKSPHPVGGFSTDNQMIATVGLLASAYLIWKYVLNAKEG